MEHREITFDKTARPPVLAESVFTANPDGSIRHTVDGRVRADIPPEGWEAYGEDWPAIIEFAAALTIATEPGDN